MHKLAQPVKLWYSGPYFRYEAPAGGPLPPVPPGRRRGDRLRLAARRRRADHPPRRAAARARGPRRRAAARRASARPEARGATATSCRPTCARTRASSSREVRERIDDNPLRAFDSKDEGTRAVMAEAPTILERLDGRRRRALRGGAAAARRRRGRLRARRRPWCAASTTTPARCSRSTATRLGAQSEVGGGGRYDGLVEQLGGPPTPGVGWAAGVERILLALERRRSEPAIDVFVAAADGRRERALALVGELRRAGLSADLDLAGRGAQGPDEAGRPPRRPARGDPRRGRRGCAARHGERRAARGRRETLARTLRRAAPGSLGRR